MALEVEAPSLNFRSKDRKASHRLGCSDTSIKLSQADFESALQEHKLVLEKQNSASDKFGKNCDPGSIIRIEMTVWDPANFTDLNRCQQLQMLLEDLKFMLKWRDTFKQMAGRASNVAQLRDIVFREMREEYPGTDLEDAELPQG